MHSRFAFLPSFLCLALLMVQTAHAEPPTTKTNGASQRGGPRRKDHYGDPLPDGAVFRAGTTRLRHHSNYDHPFANVLFSPDGKFVLSSASGEHEVRMWETSTGREVRQFPSRRSDPTFSLSADGSLLAVGDWGEIHLYDTANGKKLRRIDLRLLNSYFVSKLIFSPDGKFLAAYHSAGKPDTNRVSLWETALGKRTTDKAMPSSDWFRAFSPDARLMATISDNDRAICLYETASGAKAQEWKVEGKDPMGFRCLLFSPDGRNIVTAGADTMIRVYETATGKEARNWSVPLREADASESTRRLARWSLWRPEYARAAIGALAFAPDGQTLATVDRFDVLRLWNWKTGRELRHFKDVCGPVSFSPDGKSIAAAGMDNRIRIWSTKTGRDLCPFSDPGRIGNAAFSPDGRVLAVGSDRGPTRLFDANSGRELRQFPGYRLIAFSPKGGQLLVRRQEDDRLGPWCLLDAATGREHARFGDGEEDYFGGWDADKKLVLTCGGSSVRVWDTATGKLRREIRGKENEGEICCSPDGRVVVVGSSQKDRIRLLASDSGEEVRQLTGYKWDVRSDACRGGATVSGGGLFRPLFSADGKVLLAGCGLESLALWDVPTGKQFLRLNCDQFLPHKPIFSPNGDLLALLDPKGDPCLVDAATGRVRHRLSWKGGDLGWILKSVRAFSADGRLLAAAYDPHTIVLWEVATGRPIHTWPGHGRGELRQMTFSADSRRLATVGTDGTVLVWDVSR